MKQLAALRLTPIILLCLLLPLSTFSAEIERYNGPSRIYFSLPDFQGRTHALPDYQGKVILINFWASWCPPCIYEMPELMRLQKQFGDQPFEILAINAGEKKHRVRKFSRTINLDLRVLLDTDNRAFKDWGVMTLPTSFLVDAHGKVRYRIRGNPGWEDEETVAIINKLIAETTSTAPANQQTNNEAM